jgi:hypothetical protein
MFPKMIAIEQTRYHRTRSFVSDPATVGSGGGGGRQDRQDERTVEHQCHKMHRKDHGLFLLAKSGNVWILRVDSTKIHDETILAI